MCTSVFADIYKQRLAKLPREFNQTHVQGSRISLELQYFAKPHKAKRV